MSISAIAILGFLTFFVTQFIVRLIPRKLTGWQTQVVSAVAGIGCAFWAQNSEVTQAIMFNNQMLKDLDMGSTVMFGLLSTATGAVIPNELFRALDKNRTSGAVSETASTPTD